MPLYIDYFIYIIHFISYKWKIQWITTEYERETLICNQVFQKYVYEISHILVIIRTVKYNNEIFTESRAMQF